jgi:molybdopterin synthase catalytic subunit
MAERGVPETATAGVVVAEVTVARIEATDLLRDMGSAADGAVLAFEGRVRDHNAGRRVSALHYEAYREMADAVLADIAGEALERFAVTAVGVRHRVGSLKPRTVSLVVVVASRHRAAAYGASLHVINELKRRLPVWKKEEYDDGSGQWLESAPAAVSGPSEEDAR